MFFQFYNRMLARRPYATNALTTAFLFGTGDVLAQKVGPSKDYDLARTARAVAYGGIAFAPLGDQWYKFLARTVIGRTKVTQTVARVAVDQGVFAPFIGIPLYYLAMGLMEGRTVDDTKQKLARNWWPTLVSNWSVWPLFQAVNFAAVPVAYRLMAVNVVSIGWNCFLLMKNAES